MEEAASQLEREHVHSVYEKIAPFFNDTRYKAWPKVRQFLLDQEPGSIVADVGCGNGKYLHINENIFKLGCDVCRPLVDSAWSQGHEVQLCDGLRLPYRDGCFDAVLSIAVIHHMSTKERRIRAIKEMTRTLRVGGRIMIYVWAMEQKRRKFEKQDIFVPWNPNPPSSLALHGPARGPQRGGRSQNEGEAADSSDKHRKVRSTSSMVDDGDLATSQQKSQRLWFFSRSLDSVLDFGSLSVSRSSSREISTLCTPSDETNGPKVGWRCPRGKGLIRQMSSLFSSSRTSMEEDVFETDLQEQVKNEEIINSTEGNEAVSVGLLQDCTSVPLPDLVSYEMEQSNEMRQKENNGEKQEDDTPKQQESTASLQGCEGENEWSREKLKDSCMRYYHVFREGELTQLIENHVEELHVLHTCLDHANWCVIAEKVQVWRI
ncbi:putative tRNA methyltransferase 9B [Chanos chanos]|uniref:tRNA methyltransferase 9B n=1 Tax=Chanos chanos TaxID=29144 RepID=A0A6J2VJN9_CHACN|nr:probable tRNA methyltransferase 9B [Chanos chanos]